MVFFSSEATSFVSWSIFFQSLSMMFDPESCGLPNPGLWQQRQRTLKLNDRDERLMIDEGLTYYRSLFCRVLFHWLSHPITESNLRLIASNNYGQVVWYVPALIGVHLFIFIADVLTCHSCNPARLVPPWPPWKIPRSKGLSPERLKRWTNVAYIRKRRYTLDSERGSLRTPLCSGGNFEAPSCMPIPELSCAIHSDASGGSSQQIPQLAQPRFSGILAGEQPFL